MKKAVLLILISLMTSVLHAQEADTHIASLVNNEEWFALARSLPRGAFDLQGQDPSPFHGDVPSLARATEFRRALQAVPELRKGGVSKRKEPGIENGHTKTRMACGTNGRRKAG